MGPYAYFLIARLATLIWRIQGDDATGGSLSFTSPLSYNYFFKKLYDFYYARGGRPNKAFFSNSM